MKASFIYLLICFSSFNSFLSAQPESADISAQIVYSTFLGGSGNDASWWLEEIALDGKGNVCLALDTDSPDFPVTENAFDTTFNGGNNWGMEDIAVVKFNIDENRPEYSTYFGGNGPEFATQVFVNGEDLFLTGNLGSPDFPVTSSAFDTLFNGPSFRHADGFISQFRKNKLVYSSFTGTSGNESAFRLLLNKRNEIILVTQLAKPEEFHFDKKSLQDLAYCTVLRFTPEGDSLLARNILGTAGSIAAAADDSGYIYLCGSTSDSLFPVTDYSYDISYNGGTKLWKGDFFVTKLSPDADSIIFSTYIGGTGDESYPQIAVDRNRNIILFGTTESADYPLTPDALRPARKGIRDFVITKLSADGKKIIYSSLLGSAETSMESNARLIIHKNGDVYLSGFTDGPDFPVTPGALYPEQQGKRDIFITVLDSSLSKIKYSTYLGGEEDDLLPSIKFKDDKHIIITGTTFSPGFPVTEGCYNKNINGGSDLFICLLKMYGSKTLSK